MRIPPLDVRFPRRGQPMAARHVLCTFAHGQPTHAHPIIRISMAWPARDSPPYPSQSSTGPPTYQYSHQVPSSTQPFFSSLPPPPTCRE